MLGVIGGSGLYKLELLSEVHEREFDTPFGRPSAPVVTGKINSRDVAFLPRHGKAHQLLPHEINYCANIWALKAAGVSSILSVSAVGSLREDLAPGTFGMPSQYFDWTKGKRRASFFGDGLVAHVSMAEPSCASLRKQAFQIATNLNMAIRDELTYGCVEGPRFGTRAESFFLRNSGCDLVGMTNVPEAFLAREAQLSYTTLAIITDYDCWRDEPESHATARDIIALYQEKMAEVKAFLVSLVTQYREDHEAPSKKALELAVMSDIETLTDDQRDILCFLSDKSIVP